MCRAATKVNQTRNAPAMGVRTKAPSGPPMATSGARSNENPGAQTGADADARVSEGTNPPGVNVFCASGHGTCVTRLLTG